MSLKFHRWLHRNRLSRQKLRDSRMARWLGDWIHAREYWVPTRDSLARGWLIGTLSACSPFMGFQIIMALPFALYFHGNIPIVLGLILLTNPVTATPYYYAAYHLGSFVLGENPDVGQLPPDVAGPPDLRPLAATQDWQLVDGMLALVIGCAIIGTIIGGGGYLLIRAFWKPTARRARPLAPVGHEVGREKVGSAESQNRR